MQILKLFVRQFTCASVGGKKNFDNIKMHGMYVKNTVYFRIYSALVFADFLNEKRVSSRF